MYPLSNTQYDELASWSKNAITFEVAVFESATLTTSARLGEINATMSFLFYAISINLVACVTPSVPAGIAPPISKLISTVSASTLRKDEIVADNYINNEKTTNLDSNSLTYDPSDEIQPVSMQSFRYFFSLPLNNGWLTGMNSDMFMLDLFKNRTYSPSIITRWITS